MTQAIIRIFLLVPCLSLFGCLIHSGVVTENLKRVYVQNPDEQTLLIAGTTASISELSPFVIDDPITYGKPVKNDMGDYVETSKIYTNADGDGLIFTREFRSSTKQYFESVTVQPEGDDEFQLHRLRGYLGEKRVVAYGLYF